MEQLTFKMADAFSPDDPVAVWVMNLSIALGDLRIVGEYATRNEQPEHERIYFIRVFSSHLREIAKLLVDDFHKRQDIGDFVAGLPQEAQDARDEADKLLHSTFPLRPDVVVWEDLKRLRDDTFHYVSDKSSQARLVEAMRTVAGMRKGDMEGAYLLDDSGWLRAEYADLVVANRMHPFPQEDEDDDVTPHLANAQAPPYATASDPDFCFYFAARQSLSRHLPVLFLPPPEPLLPRWLTTSLPNEVVTK